MQAELPQYFPRDSALQTSLGIVNPKSQFVTDAAYCATYDMPLAILHASVHERLKG